MNSLSLIIRDLIGNLYQYFFLRIGVSPFTVSFARSQVVSFSHPILQADHRLFIKNPIGNFNFQAYNEPLEDLAWVFVGLFCLLTPPFLYLAT